MLHRYNRPRTPAEPSSVAVQELWTIEDVEKWLLSDSHGYTFLVFAGADYYPAGFSDLRATCHSWKTAYEQWVEVRGFDWQEVLVVPHDEDNRDARRVVEISNAFRHHYNRDKR